MRQRTMLFAGLVLAMILALAYAGYAWLQATAPALSETGSSVMPTANPIAAADATTMLVPHASASLYPQPVLGERVATVKLDDQTIYVDLAEDQAQQELGLGQRAGLGARQGMLFVFPDDAEHLFWMKGMSFPIDMIWMSADGAVIYIQPDVAPDTYPEAFGPSAASRYVLEVPASFAPQHGVKIGDRATLPQ